MIMWHHVTPQVADLQAAGSEMRGQMADMSDAFQKRLSAVASEADAAKV